MRISLLDKREDFDRILSDTLSNSTLLNDGNESSTELFWVNKYLNFVASSSLAKRHFQVLVNEYSGSSSIGRKFAQALYVKVAVSGIFRRMLSHRSVRLPSLYSEYLIIGGNHRIRLISDHLKGTVVILKRNERHVYIKNDIMIRTENQMDYAPEILKVGDDWLEEEYIEGTPLNRINDVRFIDSTLSKVCNSHLERLLRSSAVLISVENYIDLITQEINATLYSEVNDSRRELDLIVNTTLDDLRKNISKRKLLISWSHGDFQQANILLVGDTFKVIDWETANRRFYLYDLFVLFGKIRSDYSLLDSISLFIEKMGLLLPEIKITEQELYFLLLEELRFRLGESFSVNFYQSGIGVKELCDDIASYLSEK